jgi:hypothetical protein
MVHIEEVEKIQYLIEPDSIALGIFRTCCILRDECPENRKDGQQNEKKDGEFKGTEKVKENDDKSLFLFTDWNLRFFHKGLAKRYKLIIPTPSLPQGASATDGQGSN